MPFREEDVVNAAAVQRAAAHDPRPHIRLVAGPGSGKSAVIEERVRWLLANEIPAAAICAVSFTRASALDLRQRVHRHGLTNGQPTVVNVPVTTLHSLALRVLRRAGLLHAYPVDPLVLDNWELENFFDAEFGLCHNVTRKRRREDIRREHEAYWNTGAWAPPNYLPPDPPVTTAERNAFSGFSRDRTQTYACVLPGEIVGQCVQHMQAGSLNAVKLLGISHLVVDEFQDLNPMDLAFVNALAEQGAMLFVAGDDDQSIYSFRYASPEGLQTFPDRYNGCGQHSLTACFRCTCSPLATAQALIAAHGEQGRIPKVHRSLYETSTPALSGVVHRWRFPSGVAEARAIAASCASLIAEGVDKRKILILLSNQRALFRPLAQALDDAEVPYEPPRSEGFLDTEAGRLVLALVRVVLSTDDYVAHRLLLGLLRGVGVQTCNDVTELVLRNNLNYRRVFCDPLPDGVFSGRTRSALERARAVCTALHAWDKDDTLEQRVNDIAAILSEERSPADAEAWCAYAATLPLGMTLEELRDYLWADTDEQQAGVLAGIYSRLGLDVPAGGVLPPRVRVMTMHGAKGLSGQVVFIPGLEEELLPGPRRQPFPGLVLEAARLLYVSITRARAMCVLSYAQTRMDQGTFAQRTPSRFVPHLAGTFAARTVGLDPAEVQEALDTIESL